MCLSTPKLPDPPPPPVAPPPPTAVAKMASNTGLKRRASNQKRRGLGALTIRRRPTLNTGSAKVGANIY